MLLIQHPLHALGRAVHVDGADALVRILRVLFGLVEVRLFGDVLLAEAPGDIVARLRLRLRGDAHRVGTDIGDERDMPFLFGVHALVQVLRHEHDFGRGHAELIRRVLLQCGRGERRGRVRFGDALFDFGNDVRLAVQFGAHRLVLLGVLGLEFFARLFGEERLERGIFLGFILQLRRQVPVLLGHERLNFALPVHDEAQGDRLHAARRKPRMDALAQQRRELVADEPVEHAARLLGVDEVVVDLARMLQSVCDGGGGNFVEFDAVFAVFELQNVLQMPGNGFALAVRVGREVYVFRLGGLFGQALDDLLFIGIDDVGRFEILFNVYAEAFFGQVAHMPARSVHAVLPLQIFCDRFRLRRRLDDD